jgi:hypothetical protein
MHRKKKASRDTRRPPRRPRSSTSSDNPSTSPAPPSQSPPIGSPSGFELTSFRQEPLSSADSSLPQPSWPAAAAPAHDATALRPPLQPTDGPTQRISIRRSRGSSTPGSAGYGSSSSGPSPSRPPSYDSVEATRQRINPDETPIPASSPASQAHLATRDIRTFIHPLASPPVAPSGGQPQFLASAPILQVRIPPIVLSPGFSQISPWSYENPSLLDSSFSPGMSPFTTPTGGQWQSLATARRQQEQQQQHQQKHGSRDRTTFDEESVGSLGSQSSDGSSVKAPFSDQVKSLDALLTTPDPLGALGKTPLAYFNPEEEDDYLGSEMKKLEDSRRSLQQELDEANLAILIESPEKKSPQKLKASRTDATTTLKQQLFPGKDGEDEIILPSAVATMGGGVYDEEVEESVVVASDDVSKSQSWLQYLRFRNSPSSKDGVSPASFPSAGKRKAQSSPQTESTTDDYDLKRAASTASVNDEGRERRDFKDGSSFDDPSDSLASDDSLFHSLALFSERVNESVPTPDQASLNPEWNAVSPAVSPHPDVSSRQSLVVTPDTFSSNGRERDETMTPFSVRLQGTSFSSAMTSSPQLALIGSPDSVEYSEFTQGSQSPGTSFQLLNESLQTPQAPGQPSPENRNPLFPGSTSFQQLLGIPMVNHLGIPMVNHLEQVFGSCTIASRHHGVDARPII